MAEEALEGAKRRASLTALKPLMPFAFRYKGHIAAAIAALVTATAATLVLPKAAGQVVAHGFSAADNGHVDLWFLFLMATVGVMAFASACRYFLVMSLGERVIADIREAVFRHLVHLDVSFFDAARSGEILSRLTADTTLVKSVFGVSFSLALRNSLLFVGALAMMVATSPKLSGIVIGAIPVIVLPLVLAGRIVRRRSRSAQDHLADASAYAAEAVGAVRTVQAFVMADASARRFAAAVRETYDAARASILSRAWLTAIGFFMVSGSVVGVLWYGAHQVLSGALDAGILVQFLLYAVLGASALGQVSEVYGDLAQAAGAAERLAEILVTRARIVAPENPVALPEPPLGTVMIGDVRFAYPGRPDRDVLAGVGFSVKSGERVAVVGPSGAGKSTLFQLLLRFYDPVSGTVSVDGVAVETADPDAVRARIALVAQEPVIFAASVADNIAYGAAGRAPPRDEIERAAALAAADGFIRDLPLGYDTMIGERGVDLSGGQRQRIGIARALLKDAPILLLDEATSALDSESEHQVQKALDRLMVGRTTLVIAHRLATIRSADRILVMDHGRIVEEGRHDDLIARGGLYARLANLQFAAADMLAM